MPVQCDSNFSPLRNRSIVFPIHPAIQRSLCPTTLPSRTQQKQFIMYSHWQPSFQPAKRWHSGRSCVARTRWNSTCVKRFILCKHFSLSRINWWFIYSFVILRMPFPFDCECEVGNRKVKQMKGRRRKQEKKINGKGNGNTCTKIWRVGNTTSRTHTHTHKSFVGFVLSVGIRLNNDVPAKQSGIKPTSTTT